MKLSDKPIGYVVLGAIFALAVAMLYGTQDQRFLHTAIVVVFLVYALPTVVAISRRHHQRLAIVILNVLLGWTVLGWICALVWACTQVKPTGSEN